MQASRSTLEAVKRLKAIHPLATLRGLEDHIQRQRWWNGEGLREQLCLVADRRINTERPPWEREIRISQRRPVRSSRESVTNPG